MALLQRCDDNFVERDDLADRKTIRHSMSYVPGEARREDQDRART
jgi:hypothetical protein